jgi:phenylacetate-CoA ligase
MDGCPARDQPQVNPWAGRGAAAMFRAAVRSPLLSRHLAELDQLAARTPDEIVEWQGRKVGRMIDRAHRRVPAYRGPAYASQELDGMPLLTKSDVRNRPNDFLDRRVPSRRVTTGGTSGRPLLVNVALGSFFSEWAHVAYAWRTAGITPVDRKLTFRGSSLGDGFSGAPFFFQATYNHFAVSPFHLNESTFRAVIAAIEDFEPVAIWGYPSAITPFARWVLQTGPHRSLRSIKAVLLASEGAFDWQVQLFHDAFGAKVVRWYGQTEKVVFGSGCADAGGYHVLPSYGLAEVIGGRIVGTGLTNPAMPLLRYDTEDEGTLAPSCPCGMPFPWLTNLKGRWDQALLWGVEDEPISTSALNFHDPIFMNFDRFQFRQDAPGRAKLLVTTSPEREAPDSLLEQARSTLQARVGDRLQLEVTAVDSEQLLSVRGKVQTVDQRYVPVVKG